MPSPRQTSPGGARPGVRFIIGGAVASVLLFASAGAALAHAELALASPAAGVGLAQAPAAVIIKFTEPLNLDLSHIDVLDTQGVEVGQGPTEAVPGDPVSMRRALGFLTVGQYAVQWTSVSTLDGHVLQGTLHLRRGRSGTARHDVASRSPRLGGAARADR